MCLIVLLLIKDLSRYSTGHYYYYSDLELLYIGPAVTDLTAAAKYKFQVSSKNAWTI